MTGVSTILNGDEDGQLAFFTDHILYAIEKATGEHPTTVRAFHEWRAKQIARDALQAGRNLAAAEIRLRADSLVSFEGEKWVESERAAQMAEGSF